ncbi:hypothetical protein MtrunA17_Chr7g0222511 [Medicago truncatula]|uniref:Transmembrane protein n=1 Tax=Medicago truncatula TaxID=3880 RepID=A0A396GW36_MEDTR|nr:hypothetical protein MtrunA17_Chr7g0222511 [Medicago truncatula]
MKVALLTFNHHNEWYLTLSKSCIMGVWMLLKILLLCSFQTCQTHKSHKSCRKDRRFFEWPV